MTKFIIKTNPNVNKVFDSYPPRYKRKLLQLRELIIASARELKLDKIEEALKWGEPSYIAKHGSTIRIAWKEKTPNQYAMYFKCTSRLLSTFQKVFKNSFRYEGNRAILFKLEDKFPKKELKACIKVALRYHHVKKTPNLGLT